MSETISELVKKLKGLLITDRREGSRFSQTREISTPEARDIKKPISDSMVCPYCLSRDFVRRGWRQKEHERVQLYLCKSCRKTFTPNITKGKHYPLDIVLDAVSIYNLGYNLEQTCRIVNERNSLPAQAGKSQIPNSKTSSPVILGSGATPGSDSGHGQNDEGAASAAVNLQPSTLATWIKEFEPLCRYCQMRPYVTKKYSPKDTVIHANLAHRQLYRYLFHRGKCQLLIEAEFAHRRYKPLQEFLEMVPVECPHQYFQEGLRASEAPLTFSKTAMIVRAKQNFATRLCEFVLQSVKERKDRHEALQKFMLANDSVTVATEVPVYITRDDIEHMKTQLGFEIYEKKWEVRNEKLDNEMGDGKAENNQSNPTSHVKVQLPTSHVPLPKLITGHIDILQIRNGMIHILDYKPNAEKERPIEQLTLYAMALSRLTGLRLFEFKCAWFDEKDYFEFFPLHVLHKTKKARRRRKVVTKEGVYAVNHNEVKVESLRPL